MDDWDENDYESIQNSFYRDGEDAPNLWYLDGPNHNPPGIPAKGMTWPGMDGVRRCPCICHCVECISK